MGGAVGAVPNQDEAHYTTIPNNTKSSWWRDPCLRWNMMHCIGLCGTLFFNGYDGSLMNSLQSINAWQEYFHHPNSNILGLMNSSGFLPGLIVCWIADIFAHYYGKRLTVWIGSGFAIVGALIIGLAQNTGMFIGGRAVMGIGVQGTLVVAPALLQEIAHPRYRSRLSGMYMSIYYFAAIISSSVCRGTHTLAGDKSWRIPALLQVVGPILTIMLTATCPESPRWLEKRGKSAEAKAILAKYHANGDENDELVVFEYRQIQEALLGEELNAQTKYTDYFKGAGNRHRLLIIVVVSLGTNWVGNGIVSYYLSPILNTLGITDSNQQLDINVGLQTWNLLCSTAAALAIDRAGRRLLWLTSTAGMLVCFSVVMALSAVYAQHGQHAVGTAVIPFLFLFFGFYDMAWTPLSYSYPVEILTFSMRTKGQAIFVFLQTLGMAVNTWVNPIAFNAITWKYYGVYLALISLVLVIIYFQFPETRNLTIEEIAVIFDGDRAFGGHGGEVMMGGVATTTIQHDGDLKKGENENVEQTSTASV
ncbi:hypothetical protein Sste5346_007280 [Sporothrix stenoceras]|uniref:Major facilitator superfamily (MFS) profile domain-containing protein n=1 Tax=Sporothrix stenoceras TaxID=5173 RepID=A0ABR3YU95_9PEZI